MTLPPLWPHQQEGLDHVRELRGAFCAMGCGTGKTRVIVERIADLVRSNLERRCVLIFCPKAVVDTWSGQIDEWLEPDVRDQILVTAARKSSITKRLATIRKDNVTTLRDGRVHVVVINYESTRNEDLRRWLMSQTWSLVVCDESQSIKAHNSKQSKFIAKIDALQRVCLTGTPTPHSPLDHFGQMRFLTGGGQGWTRFVPFRSRYAIEVQLGGSGIKKITGFRNLDELERKLAPYFYQVKASDVLDLPGVEHVRRSVELSSKERKAYDGVMNELFTLADSGVPIVASNVLDRLLKCQQITGGGVKVTDEVTRDERRVVLGHTKREELVQILSEIPEDEPVAVFARFRHDLDEIAAAASDAGRGVLELSGRRDDLATWKEASGGEVLAVQIQSGGAGIDLTRSARVVYWSVGFSLGDYEQSLARAHRPGQTRVVQYFHLTARDTIDELIYRALSARRDLVEESLQHVRDHSERRRSLTRGAVPEAHRA